MTQPQMLTQKAICSESFYKEIHTHQEFGDECTRAIRILRIQRKY